MFLEMRIMWTREESTNVKCDIKRSNMCGGFVLAVKFGLLSQVGDKEL